MILVIGGFSQGKLAFVKSEFNIDDKKVFNKFNDWVRSVIKNGDNPVDATNKLIDENPDLIIISDEIGNGIVPMEKEERDFRDTIGGIQIMLAKQAEEVYRVTCGIGQKIK